MRITLIPKLLVIFIFALALGSCPPPSISRFVVAPSTTCAGAFVGIDWTADADEVSLAAMPATGERLPTGLPVVMGGFRFRTASSDTTYTLTARRAGQEATSSPVRVFVVSTPFPLDLELRYNCAEQYWEHPGFTTLQYDTLITVESITNHENQGLVVDSLDIPAHENRPFWYPRPLSGRGFRAYPSSGNRPLCAMPDGNVNRGGVDVEQPPVHITVTSRCP